MKTLARGALVCLALLMAGCGVLPKKTETAIYTPLPTIQPDPAWPSTTRQLVVMRPSAARLIDSARILVRPVPGELQVYAGAVWLQPAPDMLQDTVVRLLEDSGKTAGVMRRGGGIAGEYDLVMDIRRFDADYAEGSMPAAVIEVSASLVRGEQNQVAAHRLFRASTPATSTAIPDVSRAFERSLAEVSGQIAGWSLREMR